MLDVKLLTNTLLVGCFLLFPTISNAEQISHYETTRKQVFLEARKAATFGPAVINLIDQATLNLPTGYVFVPKGEAAKILSLDANEQEMQLVLPILVGVMWNENDAGGSIIDVTYEKVGFVFEEDIKQIGGEIAERAFKMVEQKQQSMGSFPYEFSGLPSTPKYYPSSHELGISSSWKDQNGSGADKWGMYLSILFGRDGYFRFRISTNTGELAASEAMIHNMLKGFSYNSEKKYESFVKGTDPEADFGGKYCGIYKLLSSLLMVGLSVWGLNRQSA